MNTIRILTDSNILEYPRDLLVYCDGVLTETIDLRDDTIITVNDNVDVVKIISKSKATRNAKSLIQFFLLSIFSMLFGVNRSEIFDYIFNDIIDLKMQQEQIQIKYFFKSKTPFFIGEYGCEILENYRYIERKIFDKWIMMFIIPIQIILFMIIFIMCNVLKNVIAIGFVIGVVLSINVYVIGKVIKANKFVKK